MVDALANAKYFSSLDLTTGFYQMKVHPDHTYKTAFVTENGLYEWLRVPFGMRNSPNNFQRLMEIVLAGLKPLQIGIYIDDIIIASKDFSEHLEKLELVFQRLEQHNLKLKPDKCHFLKTSIKYLGFVVSEQGVIPDPENLETVRNFKVPVCIKHVRAFLGLTGFYRRFIPQYAKIALPLTGLVKKNQKFSWNPEAQKSFESLKDCLLSEPCLKLPDLDQEFILACDASKFAIGAVLQQEQEGKMRPVAFVSRKLKGPEVNYSVVEKEMLSVVFAVNYFRQFLYARHFTVITDQASLSHAFKLRDPTSRIARWCMSLQQYSYTIVHRPGRSNVVADYLSRNVQANEATVEKQIYNTSEERERIKRLQREDPRWGPLIRVLEGKELPEKIKVSDEFFLNEDLLWHYTLPKSGNTRGQPLEQLVIPECMIKEVLEKCHDSVMVAHPGLTRTFLRVRSQFYFHNIYSLTKNYVETCHSCLQKRAHQPNKKAGLLRAEIASRPFERIAMDVMGPLPLTVSGNRYLLVISDYFTRWPEAYALPDVKSETIAKVLVEKFIATHGIPGKILTDRGTNFLSKAITEVYERLGIKKQNTTSYHPSANGLVEKLNHTITQALSHLAGDTQEAWDDHVPFALLAIRTAVHSSLGETPAYLVYGRDLVLPYHLLGSPILRSYSSQEEYSYQLTNRLKLAFEVVKKNLEKAAESQEKYRAKSAVDKRIVLGSRVYLYTPALKKGESKKLSKPCSGPFRVTKVLSPVNYEISLISNPAMKEVVHVDRLTKVKERHPFPTIDSGSVRIEQDMQVHSPPTENGEEEIEEGIEIEEDGEGSHFISWYQPRQPKTPTPVSTHSEMNELDESSEFPVRVPSEQEIVATPRVLEGSSAAQGNITSSPDAAANQSTVSGYNLRPRDIHGFIKRN